MARNQSSDDPAAIPEVPITPGGTRDRILNAARELFADRGLDGVTMDDVAAAAAVSRATVFNQFESKHGLVEAITAEVLAGYIRLLDDELRNRHATVEEQVRTLFERMGRGIEASRRFYRSVFREIAKISLGIDEGGPAQAARRTAAERLEQLVTRWQARRQITAEFDARDLALLFDSIVFGVITRWLYTDEAHSLVDDMTAMGEMFIRMIEPR